MNHPLNKMNTGLNAISDTDFVLGVLAAKKGTRTPKQIFGDVKSDLERERAETAFKALKADGQATEDKGGKAVLTPKGEKEAESRFGKLPGGKKAIERLKYVVMPALVLGIGPKSKAATRLSKADNLRAVTLSVIFGLLMDKEKATLTAVNSALLLRGMAGFTVSGTATDPRLAAVVQSAGDISKREILARLLLKAGLALGEASSSDHQEKTEQATDTDVAAFARKVQAVANRLSTPPFSRQVAIGQLYDAYGQENSDAGSLPAFKSRLLKANADGMIRLRPLDEPEALDAELRDRSLIETTHTRYHFIARS